MQGAGPAQSVAWAALDLRDVSSSPVVGVEITFKKSLQLKTNKQKILECKVVIRESVVRKDFLMGC